MKPWRQRFGAEFAGTAVLLAGVVGSGIMATTLAGGNAALVLLVNASATAALLYVLIGVLGPVSGAHFNPAVTALFWLRGELPRREAAGYVLAQTGGALAGVLLAHAMFGLALLQSGTQSRNGPGQWLAELIATIGLLLTVLLGKRQRVHSLAALIAAYIFAAYWFTSSTAFANPAATVARALTPTFAGIAPDDVVGFVGAQILATLVAWISAGGCVRTPVRNLAHDSQVRKT